MKKCAKCKAAVEQYKFDLCDFCVEFYLHDEKLRKVYLYEYTKEYAEFVKDYFIDISRQTLEWMEEQTGLCTRYLKEQNEYERLKEVVQIIYIKEDLTHYIDFVLSQGGGVISA